MKIAQLMKSTQNRCSGFTLMEILIVLAILAVIISLVLPNLLGQQKEANKKAAKIQVKAVEHALKLYAVDHEGEFPASIDALLSNPGNDQKWKGPYLEIGKVPTDPWGNPIQYQAGRDPPDIRSMGPDRQPNTADDLTSSN